VCGCGCGCAGGCACVCACACVFVCVCVCTREYVCVPSTMFIVTSAAPHPTAAACCTTSRCCTHCCNPGRAAPAWRAHTTAPLSRPLQMHTLLASQARGSTMAAPLLRPYTPKPHAAAHCIAPAWRGRQHPSPTPAVLARRRVEGVPRKVTRVVRVRRVAGEQEGRGGGAVGSGLSAAHS